MYLVVPIQLGLDSRKSFDLSEKHVSEELVRKLIFPLEPIDGFIPLQEEVLKMFISISLSLDILDVFDRVARLNTLKRTEVFQNPLVHLSS